MTRCSCFKKYRRLSSPSPRLINQPASGEVPAKPKSKGSKAKGFSSVES